MKGGSEILFESELTASKKFIDDLLMMGKVSNVITGHPAWSDPEFRFTLENNSKASFKVVTNV